VVSVLADDFKMCKLIEGWFHDPPGPLSTLCIKWDNFMVLKKLVTTSQNYNAPK